MRRWRACSLRLSTFPAPSERWGSVGTEPIHQHAQRPARPARRAPRPKQRVAETAPALEHALHVLRRAEGADDFVLQAPGLVRQVATGARRRDEVVERFHATRL